MRNVLVCVLDSCMQHSTQVLTKVGSKDLVLGTFGLGDLVVGMRVCMALADMLLVHTLVRKTFAYCLVRIQM
jgi:hypothetical protein